MKNKKVFKILKINGLCPYEAIAFQNLVLKLNLTADEIVKLIKNVRSS